MSARATTGCFSTADLVDDNAVDDPLFDLSGDGSYKLLRGVLQAYRLTPGDLGNYVVPSTHGHDDEEDEADD